MKFVTKTYMSRSDTKAMSSMDGGYIGDPTGGAAYGERNDPVTAMVGGSVVSGLLGASSARGAASAQSDAANRAAESSLQATRETNAMQKQMYDEGIARQAPYLGVGNTALSALSGGMGLGAAPGANAAGTAAAGQYANKFTDTFAPSDLTTDPSYKWRLQQGTQNLNASAAARGMLGSGQNLKDITNYGQEAASQEYGNAFSRFNTNQQNLYNRISALAGMGQNTAVGTAQQGNALGQSMGANTIAGNAAANDYRTSGASANAAGQIGFSNAIGGAIQGGVQNYMGWNQMQQTNQLLANMNGGGAAAASGSYAPMVAPAPVAPANYNIG